MGGIVGKLSFDPDLRLSRATVARMADALGHRGAHGSTWIGRGIGLGWRDGAPVEDVAHNETARLRVVADADLSNGRALRRQLERLGHVFGTGTDAEVMAHAYEEWGDACVDRFTGPFACAIWDDAERRLLIARDHLGIRPLAYALLHGDGVVFASEIKALLQDPAVSRECSPEAIDAYLTLGYVPSPLTIFRRISKLEAAHTLVVEGRRLTTRQFWDFPYGAAARTEGEALDLLESRLRDTVAGQVREPEAGLLTSGGLASATVATCAPRQRPALGVAVEQRPEDLVRIAETSRRLALRGELDLVTPDAAAIGRLLARHLDEPLADPAAVTQYTVFLAARQRMSVALTGLGGAALWAGYRRHRIEQIEWEMRAILRGPLARVGGGVGRLLNGSVRGAAALAHIGLPPAGACATKHAHSFFHDGCRHGIYTRRFAWQVREADPLARHVELYRRCPSDDPLARALYVDARTWLPDSRLAIADRAGAAASLRLRHPFLDRGLVELAASLPSGLKLHGTTGMYALRQLASRHLPSALLPPVSRAPARRPWLDDALGALVPATLLHDHFDNRGIFSRPALAALWGEHQSGRRDHAHRLWAVLMLEFWFREFIDGDAAAHPAEHALLVRAA